MIVPVKNSLTTIRERLLGTDSKRGFVKDYLPSLFIAISLVTLVIVGASSHAALNACYENRFGVRHDDLLLSLDQISVIVQLNDEDIHTNTTAGFHRLQMITRFVYATYGRFIETRVHRRLNVNITAQLDGELFLANFQHELDTLSGHGITLQSHITSNQQLLADIGTSVRSNLDRHRRSMTVHLVNAATMTPVLVRFFGDPASAGSATSSVLLLIETKGQHSEASMVDILARNVYYELN